MTKKDYIAIAQAFKRTMPERDPWNNPYIYGKWAEIRGTLMDLLEKDNPKFDREKFIDATEQ